MDPAATDPIKPLSNFTPQSDTSKLIRTYAKDMAALSGESTSLTPALEPPPQASRTTTSDGVSLPEYDSSPINHRETSSPKEFAPEVVDLKASDSDGIFRGWQQNTQSPPVAVPLMPQESGAPVKPAAPEPEPDREAILARLKAKVSTAQTVEATAPPTPEPSLRAAAPDFSRTPEPTLPTPHVTPPEMPAPERVETPSPLHTYSSDFADHIDTAGGSTFSVLAAQSDAGQTPKPTRKKRNIVPLLAGVAMLFIGIGAISGAYLYTKQDSNIPQTVSVPSLIAFDESVEVKGDGPTLLAAIAETAQGGVVAGNVVVTYVTLATTTGSGIPQPGGVLISKLGLPAPSILLRNIEDVSTVGVVHADEESRPFMLLKVNSYERTFAGMLAWESSLPQDLASWYPAYPTLASTTATSSASTTPVNSNVSPSFTDDVVSNYDVRVLRDASGRSLMLYGYWGKDVLIITRDEASFKALVSRLQAGTS